MDRTDDERLDRLERRLDALTAALDALLDGDPETVHVSLWESELA